MSCPTPGCSGPGPDWADQGPDPAAAIPIPCTGCGSTSATGTAAASPDTSVGLDDVAFVLDVLSRPTVTAGEVSLISIVLLAELTALNPAAARGVRRALERLIVEHFVPGKSWRTAADDAIAAIRRRQVGTGPTGGRV